MAEAGEVPASVSAQASAPTNGAENSQHIQMTIEEAVPALLRESMGTDAPVSSQPATMAAPAPVAAPSAIPPPAPNVPQAAPASNPDASSYPNPPHPSATQQAPQSQIPAPSNVPTAHAGFSPVNQVHNHVQNPPAPAQAQIAPQVHMGAMPMAYSSQPIAGYYSEMSTNSQGADGGFELISDGGGRGRKDVKRRTKTGCLTCRKRRIKCDERHPVCRNCEKSKRECLGYDPVFRPQPSLQATSSQTSFPVAAPSHALPQLDTTQTPPQPSPSASATPIPPLPSGPPAPSPSLPPVIQTSVPPPQKPDIPNLAQPSAAPTPAKSPNIPATQESYEHLLMANAIPECRNLPLLPVNIDDLLTISCPLAPIPENMEFSQDFIEKCLHFAIPYFVSIDNLLETNWFENNARQYMVANKSPLAHIYIFLENLVEKRWQTDPDCGVSSLESREARYIWDLMMLCRVAQAENAKNDVKDDPELTLAINRVKVVEALIAGSTLPTNPTSAPEFAGNGPWAPTALVHQLKRNEMKFWDSIGQYLVITDDMPECSVIRDLALIDARLYLDMLENRDFIYSLAVIRQVSRFQPRKVKNLPSSTDEKDVGAKLYVATRLLEELKDGKGINCSIKRLAIQLCRWWESPINL